MALTLAKHADCQSDVVVAREAYAAYLTASSAVEKGGNDTAEITDTSDVVTGYENNLANGTIGL